MRQQRWARPQQSGRAGNWVTRESGSVTVRGGYHRPIQRVANYSTGINTVPESAEDSEQLHNVRTRDPLLP